MEEKKVNHNFYDVDMSISDIDYKSKTMSANLSYKDKPLDTTIHKVEATSRLSDTQVKKLKYKQNGKIPTIAGGAALGALVGNALTDDDAGTVIGAGAGAIGGSILHSSLNSKYNLEIAESILKKTIKAL
jgi:uncharacterized membrane protein